MLFYDRCNRLIRSVILETIQYDFLVLRTQAAQIRVHTLFIFYKCQNINECSSESWQTAMKRTRTHAKHNVHIGLYISKTNRYLSSSIHFPEAIKFSDFRLLKKKKFKNFRFLWLCHCSIFCTSFVDFSKITKIFLFSQEIVHGASCTTIIFIWNWFRITWLGNFSLSSGFSVILLFEMCRPIMMLWFYNFVRSKQTCISIFQYFW